LVKFNKKSFQLADMNAQWEQYNGEKEIIVKRLEQNAKERQLEIEHLKRQISASDSNSVTFSPAQQVNNIGNLVFGNLILNLK